MLTESFMLKDPFSGHLFCLLQQAWRQVQNIVLGTEPDLSSGTNAWKKEHSKGLSLHLVKTSLEVDVSKLTWILEGIDLFKSRRRKRYNRKNVFIEPLG